MKKVKKIEEKVEKKESEIKEDKWVKEELSIDDEKNPDLAGEKNSEEENINEESKKKQDKQIIWIIIFMGIIIVSFFIVPYFIKNYVNSFEYGGLNFQKTKQGEIFYYSAYVPITDQNYQEIGKYPVNLREDPRKLDYIKSDILYDELSFARQNTVFITVGADSPRCTYNAMAGARLAMFLNGFASMNVAGALDNKTLAEETKTPYVTCETNPKNTVILLKYGDETSIRKLKDNCYELKYKGCEILPVTEKFQLMILEGYMNYLKGK